MKKNKIVINTLVFLKEIQEGTSQSELLEKVHNMGLENIEIRREMLKKIDKETEQIRDQAKKLNMRVFYSVPETLFANNQVRLEELEGICKEAYRMNAQQVKLAIGDIKTLEQDELKKIQYLEETYKVKITVENDQTEENGKAEKINWFLSEVRKAGKDLYFTFDIGNWIFQKEDPLENAKLLGPFVGYIHLKNLDDENNTVSLDKGKIDWRTILKQLPKEAYIGLEYPCFDTNILMKDIEEILSSSME